MVRTNSYCLLCIELAVLNCSKRCTMCDDDDDTLNEVGIEELKFKAISYYGENGDAAGVTEKMEEILNSMFFDQPPDVYGHLVHLIPLLCAAPCLGTNIPSHFRL